MGQRYSNGEKGYDQFSVSLHPIAYLTKRTLFQ